MQIKPKRNVMRYREIYFFASSERRGFRSNIYEQTQSVHPGTRYQVRSTGIAHQRGARRGEGLGWHFGVPRTRLKLATRNAYRRCFIGNNLKLLTLSLASSSFSSLSNEDSTFRVRRNLKNVDSAGHP
ncbi:hypothetical protein EVAR_92687_1 [Eumeta japonica]|uniref:Uncharacterized protein n=1 Tax=Eumeta variegata TaxID=151549 RepID=A0A4C1SZQ1_EUMVA|nr:hypothetical protein EVAR_92687_1 [Eumeta japonica]